jgi:triacylglycerol lipase
MPHADKHHYLEEIVPPYLKYAYFKDAHLDSLQFRPDARGLDMVNAWWLIESSILSYSNKESVTKEFAKVNLPEVMLFSGGSTQCYAASNDDFLILVFRGTEIWARQGETNLLNIMEAIFADVITDGNIVLDDWGYGGKVHRGFKKALDEVWEGESGLFSYLKSKDRDGRSFWFTGHSLGAALATLAWKRYRSHGNVQGLYTFGSPRVGNRDFGKGLQSTYRFVNNNDIVTMVPPPGDYRHVGCLKHINPKGFIDHGSSHAAAREQVAPAGSSFLREERRNFNAIMQKALTKISPFLPRKGNIRAGLTNYIPRAFLDHVPIRYANHIKKNIL